MSEELLKQILEKLDTIDTKVDRIEQKLDATFEQVAKSAETINEIAATQDRHERILEVLSKRSIEHESYIRRG
ncbi:hypothetical protein [Paenibacillus sp. DMB20]|uniref:hypothetical protein n=1 Tax=Paenibacillus sp. DMB20 TaxID=1642570 RepID=UPI000627FAD8|nr:hypothetical protein [Paenibacillus sp. DMB20]KKO51158.1 hypothetical protein XI25_29670 [Paenibacillus sp. DMB20]